jgi:hypothetical protein
MTAMPANARRWTLQSTQLAGWIDTAAWPKVDASCHFKASKVSQTSGATEHSAFGKRAGSPSPTRCAERALALGRALHLPPHHVREIATSSSANGHLLSATMASLFAGSNATRASRHFETLASGHQRLRRLARAALRLAGTSTMRRLRRAIRPYRRPLRRPRRPRRFITISCSPICSSPLASVCGLSAE